MADPKALGKSKLVITYAYRLGSRTKSFVQLCDEGKEIARQHNAKWDDATTCVQKTFAAGDLPATFEIDCPTPKGRYPVYPRMVFMRREVIAPDAAPLPLPAGAVAAKIGPGDELASLPNPFMIGTEPPPVAIIRAVKSVRIPLTYVQYESEKGEVSEKGTLRWPKVAAENGKVIAGAVLIDGNLKALPARKAISAARLCVPIAQGHNLAAGQLGAVLLSAKIEKGKAVNVASLSEIAGTVVIPKQPAESPEYKPAKVFSIDLTQPIRAIAAGEAKFHGLALRIVPNRAIDDGYTVRCEISPTDEVYLELDVFAD